MMMLSSLQPGVGDHPLRWPQVGSRSIACGRPHDTVSLGTICYIGYAKTLYKNVFFTRQDFAKSAETLALVLTELESAGRLAWCLPRRRRQPPRSSQRAR